MPFVIFIVTVDGCDHLGSVQALRKLNQLALGFTLQEDVSL